MDQSIYIAANAANAIFEAQAVHSNNLANVSTHGFKADLAYFQSDPVSGDGFESRENTSLSDSAYDFSGGALVTTGRSLDIAIDGEGFLAVQTLDGKEAYTRNGNLSFDSAGVLVTSHGLPILGNGGPIILPQADSVEIGGDGTVSILPAGANSSALAVIDRIKLVNPEVVKLQKGADGLFRHKEKPTADPDGSVKVVSRALEASNVNAVQELTDIIALARQFEAQLKMMSSIEEVDTETESLLAMNG